jgi:outer membrane biosynthesis protein TonB
VVGLCTTGATLARAEKPVIAVLPFIGPQSQKAEAVVVRALRHKATLIPPTRWQQSAKKLFAPSHSPDDIASVAQDVGARIVVTGVVKRDGRNWQLAVSVRDGQTGKSRDKLKYPLKGPRIEPRTLTMLGTEIEAAFQHAVESTGAGGEEEEGTPPPPKAKPAPPPPPPPVAEKPTPKPKVQPIEEEIEPGGKPEKKPAPQVAEKEETPPGMAAAEPVKTSEPPAQAKKTAQPVARPRWAPYFDLSLGGTISGRTFDFTPASLPHFTSGVVGGVTADLTLYPLAGTWRAAKGVFAGLGVGATLVYPVWPPSKGPDGNTYDTQELSVSGGIRWRIPLYKPIPRPELLILAGGGYHSFTIAKKVDQATGALTDVGPPDVGYAHLSFGLGLRLHFAEWARIWFTFQYVAVLDAGAVTTADEYGPATVFGLRPAGGLDFFVYKGLKIGVGGYYERYELDFLGSNPPPAKPGNGQLAQTAIDQYFGGFLSLGYEL